MVVLSRLSAGFLAMTLSAVGCASADTPPADAGGGHAQVSPQGQGEGSDGLLRADRKAYRSLSGSFTNESGEFETVPGLGVITVANRGPVEVAVDVEIQGGSAEFRVARSRRHYLEPNPITFQSEVGSPGASAHSFSFFSEGRRALCRTYELQWRPGPGEPTELRFVSVAVSYKLARKIGCG